MGYVGSVDYELFFNDLRRMYKLLYGRENVGCFFEEKGRDYSTLLDWKIEINQFFPSVEQQLSVLYY